MFHQFFLYITLGPPEFQGALKFPCLAPPSFRSISPSLGHCGLDAGILTTDDVVGWHRSAWGCPCLPLSISNNKDHISEMWQRNRGKRENTGILVSTSVKMYLLCKNKSPPMLGVLRVSMPLHISLVFYILAWVASRLCRKVCLDRKKVEKQQSDKACRSLKVDNILYIHTYYTCMCLLYSFRPKVFIRLHGN